jgi:hypothetical protein
MPESERQKLRGADMGLADRFQELSDIEMELAKTLNEEQFNLLYKMASLRNELYKELFGKCQIIMRELKQSRKE